MRFDRAPVMKRSLMVLEASPVRLYVIKAFTREWRRAVT